MIFNCPSCNAGHSIPASTIPAEGVELSCRRCSTAFRVETPEKTQLGGVVLPDEEDSSSSARPDSLFGPVVTDEDVEAPAGEPEATSIGVVSPFEFESSEPSLLRAPSGLAIPKSERPSVRSSSGGVIVDREGSATFATPVPTVPQQNPPRRTSTRPGADESSFDPELDATSKSEEPEAEAASPGVARPTPSAPPAKSRSRGGIEERLAARAHHDGRRGPDASGDGALGREARGERVAEAVPSLPTTTKTGMLLPLRNITETFRGPSLPLRIALVVVPLLLVGTIFLVGPGRDPWARDRVEIPARPTPTAQPVALDARATTLGAPQLAVAEPVDVDPGEAAPREAAPPSPKAESKVERAADGELVVLERARLRAAPSEKAPNTGAVEVGQRVRVYERMEGFAFVLVLPRGPGGFLSERSIGPASAAPAEKAFAYTGCEPRLDETKDDCLFRSKVQSDACLDTCPTWPGGRAKCEATCDSGFEECRKACRLRRR